jgi:hypothetical protein
VRVGEIVHCYVVPTPRGVVMIAVGIIRRPGVKIPEAEDDYLYESMRMHVVFGKAQAMEEAREQACRRKMAQMLARVHR